MPPGWPACPEGIPLNYQAPPGPVNPSLLGTIADDPQSKEGKEALARVLERADRLLPVCQACPGGHYLGVSEDGVTVDCKKGSGCCCGGSSVRGPVHLGAGTCLEGYWAGR